MYFLLRLYFSICSDNLFNFGNVDPENCRDNDANNYYEYVNSPQSPYTDVIGHNVRSRYLTEDVPGLNVPAMQLAAKAAVQTPIIELTVRLTSWLHSVDYIATGTNLEKLGIADKAPEEIVSLTA